MKKITVATVMLVALAGCTPIEDASAPGRVDTVERSRAEQFAAVMFEGGHRGFLTADEEWIDGFAQRMCRVAREADDIDQLALQMATLAEAEDLDVSMLTSAAAASINYYCTDLRDKFA